MKQGEIWNVTLDPVEGGEQAGYRPVVVISGNLLNQHLPIVIVVPLTTSIKRYKGNPVLTPSSKNGLTSESEMLVFHIRSISKERLISKLGEVDGKEVVQAVRTLNDILRY